MPEQRVARSRRARGSLSAEEIVEAASRLLEREGLRALSMSSLARDLGASTASIYWYFRGRDDLLVGVVERVFRDIYDRLPSFVEEDWAAGAFQFFSGLRAEMARRPMILELTSERPGYFFSQRDIVAASSQHRRAWVALLTRLGVDADQAARMFRACLGYTHGVALREFGRRLEHSKSRRGHHELSQTPKPLSPEEFPILSALSDLRTESGLYSGDFERGLCWILDGIQLTIDRTAEVKEGK